MSKRAHNNRPSNSRAHGGASRRNGSARFADRPLPSESRTRSTHGGRSSSSSYREAVDEERQRAAAALATLRAPFPGRTIAVVGGGAAGLAAAITAAESARTADRTDLSSENPGEPASDVARTRPVRVVILEAEDRVGKPVLATGNGRCNFSNKHIDVDRYYNAGFVQTVRDAASAQRPSGACGESSDGLDAAHRFFRDLGLVWREEEDGRQYPLANKASVVVNVLRSAARACGVVEVPCAPVERIVLPGERSHLFGLQIVGGQLAHADAVIVAAGGAPSALEIEGVSPLRLRPVLGPLKVRESCVRELDNIRAKAQVALLRRVQAGDVCAERSGAVADAAGKPAREDDPRADAAESRDGAASEHAGGGGLPHGFAAVARESGEVMFRTYGVSGIAAFNLSRFAWPDDVLTLNFLEPAGCEDPDRFAHERLDLLARRHERFGEAMNCENFLEGVVLPQIGHVVLKRCALAADDGCSEVEALRLARELACFRLTVAGIGDARTCQVHRGGIDVASIDGRTMALAAAPGLFAAGEAVDVDGPCGGYNLDWAWTSGIVAGRSAYDFLESSDAGARGNSREGWMACRDGGPEEGRADL